MPGMHPVFITLVTRIQIMVSSYLRNIFFEEEHGCWLISKEAMKEGGDRVQAVATWNAAAVLVGGRRW